MNNDDCRAPAGGTPDRPRTTARPGSLNGRAKLTDDDVRQIREYRGREFQKITAHRFGISTFTVLRIQLRRIWRHLP